MGLTGLLCPLQINWNLICGGGRQGIKESQPFHHSALKIPKLLHFPGGILVSGLPEAAGARRALSCPLSREFRPPTSPGRRINLTAHRNHLISPSLLQSTEHRPGHTLGTAPGSSRAALIPPGSFISPFWERGCSSAAPRSRG